MFNIFNKEVIETTHQQIKFDQFTTLHKGKYWLNSEFFQIQLPLNDTMVWHFVPYHHTIPWYQTVIPWYSSFYTIPSYHTTYHTIIPYCILQYAVYLTYKTIYLSSKYKVISNCQFNTKHTQEFLTLQFANNILD